MCASCKMYMCVFSNALLAIRNNIVCTILGDPNNICYTNNHQGGILFLLLLLLMPHWQRIYKACMIRTGRPPQRSFEVSNVSFPVSLNTLEEINIHIKHTLKPFISNKYTLLCVNIFDSTYRPKKYLILISRHLLTYYGTIFPDIHFLVADKTFFDIVI